MQIAITSQEILDIALDCGLDNRSYFYRVVRRKYGQAPRAYRMNAFRSIAP